MGLCVCDATGFTKSCPYDHTLVGTYAATATNTLWKYKKKKKLKDFFCSHHFLFMGIRRVEANKKGMGATGVHRPYF